jgi:tetratricopeptide (TPR) repeat protein
VYFLTLVEEARPHLYCSEQIAWLDRLEEELDNLRAAWGWCVARGQTGDQEAPERGMATAGSLFWFWQFRGHFQEGREWLTQLLAATVTPARTHGRVTALGCLGVLHGFFGGDLTAAEALGEGSVAIARALGDQLKLALALYARGAVCAFLPRPGTDDLARARAYLAEAQTLCEEVGKEDGIVRSVFAFTVTYQGVAALAAGDLENAETYLTMGLELARVTGHRQNVAIALERLGLLAWMRGNLAGACTLLEQALTYGEALQDRYGTGYKRTLLGDLLRQTGDPRAAGAYYAHALRMLHSVGHAEISHQAICGLAVLAMEAGDPQHALSLVSVSKSLSALTGVLPAPRLAASIEQVETIARQALSPEAQAAWAAGQTMRMEQVIAQALGGADGDAA